MGFSKKVKQKVFWKNFIKVTVPFFIVVIVVALVMGSASDIFSGNFEAVNQANFANGKWKIFFGYKVLFSVLYGLWTTNKNMK